ncbi:hypothetical protein NM688_g3123 [Phlebia brevispora]|uniref:Uncharacterized protein n=1 Tax=Phlebia brevispora TaxID=194682 RepID=A0ACC1T6J6_9APHY|nr:hypothetical protein NM688_g3123 [Phlebia brevispora]
MAASNVPPNFFEVASAEHFQSLLSKDLQRISLINFWAPWAEPCKQMNEVVVELAKKYERLLVLQSSMPLQVDAESQTDISESFEIEAVPTFIILRGHTLLGRISGADAARLTADIEKHVRAPPSVTPQSHTDQAPAAPMDISEKEESQEELNKRLHALMQQDKVVLFMKGSPDQPRCGFSRKIVALLRDQGVQFAHFDILTDESVRSGLKVLNNWPTFPQLIVNGEFVGGLDIVQEMVENGEFKELMFNIHSPEWLAQQIGKEAGWHADKGTGRPLEELLESDDPLKDDEAQRLRNYATETGVCIGTDLDAYGNALVFGNLPLVQVDFIRRVARFMHTTSSLEDAKVAAAENIAQLRWGPTRVPIYDLLLSATCMLPFKREGQLVVTRWLARSAKVPVNGKDVTGTTALYHAISTQPVLDLEFAEILYGAGGEVNERNRYGCTPANEMCMVQNGRTRDELQHTRDGMRWFLSHGGNLDIEDYEGMAARPVFMTSLDLWRRGRNSPIEEVHKIILDDDRRRKRLGDRVCTLCGREPSGGIQLEACPRCLQVKYCSAPRDCRNLHWPKHRAICKTAGDLEQEEIWKHMYVGVRGVLWFAVEYKPFVCRFHTNNFHFIQKSLIMSVEAIITRKEDLEDAGDLGADVKNPPKVVYKDQVKIRYVLNFVKLHAARSMATWYLITQLAGYLIVLVILARLTTRMFSSNLLACGADTEIRERLLAEIHVRAFRPTPSAGRKRLGLTCLSRLVHPSTSNDDVHSSSRSWYSFQAGCCHLQVLGINIQSLPPSAEEKILNDQRLQRPSSPHFTIYQPQLTWISSIANRMTGAGLSGLLYAFSLAYLVAPETFSSAHVIELVSTLPEALKYAGKLILAGPFAFHFLNGLRHLGWDTGRFLTLKSSYAAGYAVLGATAVSTVALVLM